MLLGVRGTLVLLACLRPLHNGARPALEPASYEWQVRCPTDSATTPGSSSSSSSSSSIRNEYYLGGIIALLL